MKYIFLREINAFFSSYLGFVTIAIYVTITGLLLWFFPEYSVLEYGYSSLELFFNISPILMMIIVPAITMKLFSEEKSLGTIEWLYTKPISDWQIIIAKYFASIVLIFISLLPTLIYYFSIYQLGLPKGNIDTGGVIGSYFGLMMLSSCFAAIGLFSSSLTKNQIISFIIAILICSSLYWSFDMVSNFTSMSGVTSFIFKNFGIAYHYESISKGVIDSRDLVYFMSIIFLFNLFTYYNLEKRKY